LKEEEELRKQHQPDVDDAGKPVDEEKKRIEEERVK